MIFRARVPFSGFLIVALSLAGCGGTSLNVDGGGSGGGDNHNSSTGGAPGTGTGGNNGACPTLGCASLCPNAVEIDPNGCPTCRCKPDEPPSCPKGACTLACPNGLATDANGCPICACKPPPTCGPVCKIYCDFGNVPDANDCPTCKCNAAPLSTECDRRQCPPPAPGAPNYICPDGKTIAGPACVTQLGSGCGWVFASCPDTCAADVACVAGTQWNEEWCMGVP